MLSTCVVVDHRRDDLITDGNTVRGDRIDNAIEKYFDLPLPKDKILATYVWIDGSGEHLRYKDRTLDFIPKTPKDKFTRYVEAWNNKLMEEMLSNMANDQSAKYLPPYDYFPRNLENMYQIECRLRTKRNVNSFDENIKDLPILSYDGFGTQQAKRADSDQFLKPRAIYRNPFRHGNHLLVMCDTYDKNLEPTRTNHRVKCADAYKKCKEDEPWFGIEQEFFFLNRSDSRPLGWPKGGYPRRAEHYYCGIGADKMFGRDIINTHYRCCLFAGIPVYGTNAEIGPSQWEYQVGPSVGVNAGDDLWMSRFILKMLAAENGVEVELDPKPFKDWEGSGAHINFSTKKMREENGIEIIKETDKLKSFNITFKISTGKCRHIVYKLNCTSTYCWEIEKAIHKLERVPTKHIKAYDPHGGRDNARRLTGHHETEYITNFSAGIAERFCSVRIPRVVAENKKGFVEDRRPASNCDPYQAIDALMRTCILNQY